MLLLLRPLLLLLLPLLKEALVAEGADELLSLFPISARASAALEAVAAAARGGNLGKEGCLSCRAKAARTIGVALDSQYFKSRGPACAP